MYTSAVGTAVRRRRLGSSPEPTYSLVDLFAAETRKVESRNALDAWRRCRNVSLAW